MAGALWRTALYKGGLRLQRLKKEAGRSPETACFCVIPCFTGERSAGSSTNSSFNGSPSQSAKEPGGPMRSVAARGRLRLPPHGFCPGDLELPLEGERRCSRRGQRRDALPPDASPGIQSSPTPYDGAVVRPQGGLTAALLSRHSPPGLPIRSRRWKRAEAVRSSAAAASRFSRQVRRFIPHSSRRKPVS
ncbi:hypothetical protein PM3016_5320 [Paenibacillus mucilaginosus 3016]|uniref:Uncharacterized protein n=1 Tax=Paenibacillus mucilaginosus 3016 TaxID=1116391 RepID=H6NB55_9BACL|nr:hypothetical protein PM3016_5320 [Paenibacillus mucilaginosus 3016]